MRFVIVGYGRVGARTARVLDEEGHAVTVVDPDTDRVESAASRGLDAVKGDGGDEQVLLEAGLERADALGGLTGDPNVNFAACMVAKEHDCRVVMRIDADYREDIYERYATEVDQLIYPARLGAVGAKTAMLGGNFNALGDLTERLQLLSVHVPEDAPVVGSQVNAVDLGDRGRIYAHGSGGEPMTIPLPGTTVSSGDRLAMLVERELVDEVTTELLGD